MSTPPRSAMSSPASRASSSRGRTPAAKITSPASMAVPSLSVTRASSRPPDAAGCVGRLDLGADAGVHRDAEVADHPAQQGAAGLVHLLGHQPRRHLHDVGVQSERAQRVGGLQTEQATTDHHADRRVSVRRARVAASARIASRSSRVR